MPIESKLYSALTASVTLTALTGDSIYPIKRKQGDSLPAVVYRRQHGDRHYSLQGYVSLENPHIELEVQSTSVDNLRVVGDAVLGALSSAGDFTAIPLQSPQDEYSQEVKAYIRTYIISLWNPE